MRGLVCLNFENGFSLHNLNNFWKHFMCFFWLCAFKLKCMQFLISECKQNRNRNRKKKGACMNCWHFIANAWESIIPTKDIWIYIHINGKWQLQRNEQKHTNHNWWIQNMKEINKIDMIECRELNLAQRYRNRWKQK